MGKDEDEGDQKKKRSFKGFMRDFSENSSISGVPHIAHSKSLVGRTIWSFLLICSLAAMFAHLYLLVDNFTHWPKKTTLNLGFSNLDLPAITLCNANPFIYDFIHYVPQELQDIINTAAGALDYDTIDNLNLSQFYDDDYYYYNYYDYYDYYYYYQSQGSGSGPGHQGFSATRDNYESLLIKFHDVYMDMSSEERKAYGHLLTEMLARCTFGMFRCYPENFTQFLTRDYGNCYTLDIENLKISRPGPSAGLSMILFLQNHLYIPGITDGYGIRVHIHAPNTMPFPYESGFYVQAGQETSISLKQTIINRIGDPHGVCETSEHFNKLYGKTYNRQSCQYLCKATQTMDNCGCYNEEDQELLQNTNVHLEPCKEKSQIGCMKRISTAVDSKALQCHCPDPCREISYTLHTASRQWPTESYAPRLVDIACRNSPFDCQRLRESEDQTDIIRRQFLKIILYYEELNFSEITEEPDIEDVQFASDFGGAIGLWIGLSVLSFFEVFQLVVELIHYFGQKFFKSFDENTDQKREGNHSDNPGYDDSELSSLPDGNEYEFYPEAPFPANYPGIYRIRPAEYYGYPRGMIRHPGEWYRVPERFRGRPIYVI